MGYCPLTLRLVFTLETSLYLNLGYSSTFLSLLLRSCPPPHPALYAFSRQVCTTNALPRTRTECHPRFRRRTFSGRSRTVTSSHVDHPTKALAAMLCRNCVFPPLFSNCLAFPSFRWLIVNACEHCSVFLHCRWTCVCVRRVQHRS